MSLVTYKLATYVPIIGSSYLSTSDVQACKMLYFVARVGLGIRLGLGLVFGRISPVDMTCKHVCVCACEQFVQVRYLAYIDATHID